MDGVTVGVGDRRHALSPRLVGGLCNHADARIAQFRHRDVDVSA